MLIPSRTVLSRAVISSAVLHRHREGVAVLASSGVFLLAVASLAVILG